MFKMPGKNWALTNPKLWNIYLDRNPVYLHLTLDVTEIHPMTYGHGHKYHFHLPVTNLWGPKNLILNQQDFNVGSILGTIPVKNAQKVSLLSSGSSSENPKLSPQCEQGSAWLSTVDMEFLDGCSHFMHKWLGSGSESSWLGIQVKAQASVICPNMNHC